MPLVYVDLGSNQGNMEVLLDGEGRGSFFFSLRDHRAESYAGRGQGRRSLYQSCREKMAFIMNYNSC